MPTTTTRVFRSGNSAAVRLPKDVAFPVDTELTVVRSGGVITMYPKRLSRLEMLEKLDQLPLPDSREERERLEFPGREGL